MKLDLRLTLYFAIVAEEGSFTRAAERLRIAQPWLSTQIRKLEDQLGFALFERTTRRVDLTEEGRIFLQCARTLAQSAAAAEEVVCQLRRRSSARLRIGAPPYSSNVAARYDLLRSFSQHRPGVGIELEVGYSPVLQERLRAGELDLAFLTGPAVEDIEEITLCDMGVELQFRADDPLAAYADAVPAEALAGRRVAVYTRALHPWQFDILYAPLQKAGARLVEVFDVDANLILQDPNPSSLVMAHFRFTLRSYNPPGVVARPLRCSPVVPFKLVRRKDRRFAASDSIWQLAVAMERKHAGLALVEAGEALAQSRSSR
ncbi:LysR family transcriptional regulator [Xanthobacter autotrophicus]|uniref:LysR family transcriptional regulator n=1 Tax=Xanthobacter autotrophicus TaxID=280 RepID=UPI00372C6B91